MDCNFTQPQKLDALYVNNWLGVEDAIHDLSVDSIVRFKKIIMYYAKVIAPNKKVRIIFSGDTAKYPGYSVVEVPYSLVEKGKLDEAVGVVMHKLRVAESAEPGIGGYSVAWDMFALFMKSCSVKVKGSTQNAWDIFIESCEKAQFINRLGDAEKVGYSCSSTYSRDNILCSIIEGNGIAGIAQRYPFFSEFLMDCLSDINLVVKAVNEVRLDVQAPNSIKKYLVKSIDSNWETYKKHRDDYPEIAKNIMDFKFFFYNKHTDYKCARGITKKDFQRCSARKLIELAIRGFQKEINERLTGRLEMFLRNLEKTYWEVSKGTLHAYDYYGDEGPDYTSDFDSEDFTKNYRLAENNAYRDSSFKGHRTKTTSGSGKNIKWESTEVEWLGEFEKAAKKDETYTLEDSILEDLGYHKKSEAKASDGLIKSFASVYTDRPYDIHWTDITIPNHWGGVPVNVTFPTVVIDTYKIKN